MNSTTSPTGLYSGGLRWVDPPGAAAGSVKPRDRAGPGPLKLMGAPPLSPAVRGRPQLTADALGGSRRAAGVVGNRPGLEHGGGAGPVRASVGPEAREHQRRGNVKAAGRACSSCEVGQGRVGQVGSTETRLRRPGQSERAGSARRSVRVRRPGQAGRPGLGKVAVAGWPCRWFCAAPRSAGACRGVNFEQSFAFYDLASGGFRQMVRYMSVGGIVHDDH